MKPGRRSNRRRQGVALALAIVISVVLSGIVIAIGYAAAAQSQMTANLGKIDSAFFAAEAGAERALWYLRNNPSNYHNGTNLTSVFTSAPFNNSGALSGACNGFSYTTTCSINADYSLQITSVGSSGSISYNLTLTAYPPAQGLPTFASGGNWDNKNTIVTGDIQTGGDFTNSGGSGSVTGNVFYGGIATGTNDVDGVARYVDPSNATDPNTFINLDWTIVQQRLDAVVNTEGSGATITGDQSNKMFDFTALPGTDKVYKVTGNVTDPSFKGSGTLLVMGSLSFSKNVTIGTATTAINLVTMGSVANISFDKKAVIYGSLYAQGDWDRAQTDVHGMVYVQGITRSNSGTSSLDATGITVPFFDTRAAAGSIVTSPMRITNFRGPQS